MNDIGIILVKDIENCGAGKKMFLSELDESNYFFKVKTEVSEDNPLFKIGGKNKIEFDYSSIKNSKKVIEQEIQSLTKRKIYEDGECFVSLKKGGRR